MHTPQPADDGHSSSWSQMVQHFAQDRRYAAMVGLGFSTGLPYILVYITQSAWLSEAKVPIELIGLLSWLTIAYQVKFLWSPFLDRYDPPIFADWLGRRRAWILFSQLAVMVALAGIALGDPGSRLWWTIAFSLALGVAGATQDVCVDGWRITAAPKGKQSLMTAFSEIGYRFGTLAAGAGALLIADRFGWPASYLCMAAFVGVGAISALLAPEPEGDHHRPGPHPSLYETAAEPVRDLYRRLGTLALPVLILIAGFRMPGYIANTMAVPLFKSLHYSDADIAWVTKIFGFGLALTATLFSAFIVRRLGIMVSLVVGTVAASASHLALAWLSTHGGTFSAFVIAVGIEGFAYAFAQMVLITFMSLIVSKEMAASQFALLTSLCAIPGHFLAGFSGFIIKHTGYEQFFVLTSLIGVPVALLAWYVLSRYRAHDWSLPRPEAAAVAH
ncbi:MAG: MFS transporter [Proteobacteria bacterium]|nr:MFS transporter [Pseudomonadota bacterium]